MIGECLCNKGIRIMRVTMNISIICFSIAVPLFYVLPAVVSPTEMLQEGEYSCIISEVKYIAASVLSNRESKICQDVLDWRGREDADGLSNLFIRVVSNSAPVEMLAKANHYADKGRMLVCFRGMMSKPAGFWMLCEYARYLGELKMVRPTTPMMSLRSVCYVNDERSVIDDGKSQAEVESYAQSYLAVVIRQELESARWYVGYIVDNLTKNFSVNDKKILILTQMSGMSLKELLGRRDKSGSCP